jgi:hypothetical protein
MTDYAFALHLDENRRHTWNEYDIISTNTDEPEPEESSEEEVIVKQKKIKHYMYTTSAHTHRMEQTD